MKPAGKQKGLTKLSRKDLENEVRRLRKQARRYETAIGVYREALKQGREVDRSGAEQKR